MICLLDVEASYQHDCYVYFLKPLTWDLGRVRDGTLIKIIFIDSFP